MSLIYCPECKNQISDKAEHCPHCGLPSAYFKAPTTDVAGDVDYTNLGNLLISFDRDYCSAFGQDRYITNREKLQLKDTYGN